MHAKARSLSMWGPPTAIMYPWLTCRPGRRLCPPEWAPGNLCGGLCVSELPFLCFLCPNSSPRCLLSPPNDWKGASSLFVSECERWYQAKFISTQISCSCLRIIRSRLERKRGLFFYHHSFNWLKKKVCSTYSGSEEYLHPAFFKAVPQMWKQTAPMLDTRVELVDLTSLTNEVQNITWHLSSRTFTLRESVPLGVAA